MANPRKSAPSRPRAKKATRPASAAKKLPAKSLPAKAAHAKAPAAKAGAAKLAVKGAAGRSPLGQKGAARGVARETASGGSTPIGWT